ncbi:LuxR C-terminal-related transcriptional regulator [Chenggangzhangella methanolivorans]|uniref:Response regulator transcription factor n=1 Tax=Chenggangzhangella methanolivorans TaxID=1437009 RepID=A0A9E6R6S6_9HYPH|nr:response regulator transcription factor [Chenggangzhangella methanolivorans]QZN98993.1 response regulator transcription factor [Chenggangzhangella methanolivorans]
MKILIADDHWVVRESLKQVMRRLQQTLDVFEAETFAEAEGILAQHPDIDLMLVDLVMPGFEEFDGLRRLRAAFPDTPVVVISVHEDVDHVMRSLEQGVIGYIPKSSGGSEIERALERVLEGEVSFPRRIIERSSAAAATRVPASVAPRSVPSAAASTQPERDTDNLTARERDVLSLLGQGFSVKRIASELDLSSQTVRVHLGNVMKKLNMRDRSEAVHYAISNYEALAERG